MDAKIAFKIGKNKIKLTHEEALELRQALNDIFKDVYYPSWPSMPIPQYPLSPWYEPSCDYWYTISGGTS